MKIKYLFIGMLSSIMTAKAQKTDSVFQKKIISQTDIQLLFSYYSQDGDHSAVTGGIGTEKLTAFAPGFSISHSKANHAVNFDAGVDAITSASTDNIDFVVSSASRTDNRAYAHIGYMHSFPKSHLETTAKTGLSIESDYTSIPVIFNAKYTAPDLRRTFFLGMEYYYDDLRWGRITDDYYGDLKLVYPSELRYKQWFDHYLRFTYNLKPGFTQVINQRMIAGIFSDLSYQHGLLSTPFHRVYFNNDSLRVENLPVDRFKIPVGAKLNIFVGGRTILKGNYNFYADTWGIIANAFQLESSVKLNPKFTLSPFGRIYHQSAARYFAPYYQHSPEEKYYSSDYDLSKLNSYKLGLGFHYFPLSLSAKKFSVKELEIRYTAYFQSTGLYAQSVTLLIDMSGRGTEEGE